MTTEIKIGDSRQLIHELEDNSVDCVMTSPPYWALRDYGHNDQIGMEDTPEDYLNNMLNLFNDIKTKLKNTGNCFVNLGDTYASNTKGSGGTDKQQINGSDRQHFNSLNVKSNLPNKCMCMIPERFAWGMIQNGWILRNKIVWYKPNHMPEPVTDRLTKSYEMIYHFTKSQKYYYDLDAIREPHITQEKRPSGMVRSQNYNGKYKGSTINPEISSSPRARTQRQYSVVERINDVVEYRKNLPELIDLKKYLNKYKAQSNLTIDNIENIFGNKSPHHWLNGECYPSSEDWIKLKTILNFDDMYDIVMTTLYQKKSDKINNPLGKNPGDMWNINNTNSKSKFSLNDNYRQGMNRDETKKSIQRKNKINQKEIAQYLKKYVKNNENLLDDTFGMHKWRHWIRTDDKGSSLPSIDDWKKLKDILNLDNKYDIMLEFFEKPQQIINNPKGKNPGDMWAINTKPYSEAHFAVYPLELVKKPILAGCPVGGTVLDPFGGSGTTAEFCRNNDRNCIIFELNPEYEKLIKKRSMSDIPELTQYIQ